MIIIFLFVSTLGIHQTAQKVRLVLLEPPIDITDGQVNDSIQSHFQSLAKVFKYRLQILQITVCLCPPKLLLSQKIDLKVSKYLFPGLRGGGGRAAEARAAGDRQEEPRLGVQTLEAEPGELWLVETRA